MVRAGRERPGADGGDCVAKVKVEADRLRKVLGLTQVSFHGVNHPIAVTDVPLEGPAMASAGDHAVSAPLIVG